LQRENAVAVRHIGAAFGGAFDAENRWVNIMTKLRRTSETTIVLVFLVMNLDKILRGLLLSLLEWLLQRRFSRIEGIVLEAAQ
jgi:hypothetical protein